MPPRGSRNGPAEAISTRCSKTLLDIAPPDAAT